MKIYLLALLFVMTVGLEAKGVQWKKITHHDIDVYKSSEYHLKNDVKCLEIRTYIKKKNKFYSNYWSTPLSWSIRPYNTFDPKLMKKFRDAKPDFSRNSDMGKREAGSISNAFVLDTQNKMWRMNMAEDVIRFLGDIDTLAEAQLVLWLYGKQSPNRYRKTSRGYEFLIEYTKSSAGCQKCKPSETCIEDKEIKEKAIVDKKGDIVLFKQLESRILKQECIIN